MERVTCGASSHHGFRKLTVCGTPNLVKPFLEVCSYFIFNCRDAQRKLKTGILSPGNEQIPTTSDKTARRFCRHIAA